MHANTHIIIIGNGIAGITAARHIRKRSDCRITVISSESPWFFSRTAMMYVYMGQMKWEHTMPYEKNFWKKNRIDLMLAHVRQIQPDSHQIVLSDGTTLGYDRLILATGSVYNKLGCPGESLDGVQGLYHFQDLERLERNSRGIRNAVVIGGGLIGVELAEMFRSRGIGVDFIIRENGFWGNVLGEEEAAMVGRHLMAHGVRLHTGQEVMEMEGNEKGRVSAVLMASGEKVDCQLAAVAIGVSPNADLARKSGIACGKGIQVNSFLQTNQPDIYAIGDCAELITPPDGHKAIEPVWYTGRLMGEAAAAILCGEIKEYDPGPWFNSAKFFEWEYQVYGEMDSGSDTGTSHVFWQDESAGQSLRIAFHPVSRRLKGIQAIGIRLRHAVAECWLKKGALVDEVIGNLRDINFQPEFSADWIRPCQESLNRAVQQSI